MPAVTTYNSFGGRHWETGSAHNYFSARGFVAPHTGEPYSEAMLLGVSGGITVGYFTFLYEGYDPQCNILTRNTFDPWDTMLSRLGVVQNVHRTGIAARAEDILVDELSSGSPAIVWADMWTLAYNSLEADQGMWANLPIVVFGLNRQADAVSIADRATIRLTVTTANLAAARNKVKKDKHQLITLEPPDPRKLPDAVRLGIWDTIKLMTEKPPRGSANNFGLRALRKWARVLRNPSARAGWHKLFPPGPAMVAGLSSAFNFAFLFGKGRSQDAERGTYADFLREAAILLKRPALAATAQIYQESAAEWRRLSYLMLPEHVPPLNALRDLLTANHHHFLETGSTAEQPAHIAGQTQDLAREDAAQWLLANPAGAVELREAIAGQLDHIHEIEAKAIKSLQNAIS